MVFMEYKTCIVTCVCVLYVSVCIFVYVSCRFSLFCMILNLLLPTFTCVLLFVYIFSRAVFCNKCSSISRYHLIIYCCIKKDVSLLWKPVHSRVT